MIAYLLDKSYFHCILEQKGTGDEVELIKSKGLECKLNNQNNPERETTLRLTVGEDTMTSPIAIRLEKVPKPDQRYEEKLHLKINPRIYSQVKEKGSSYIEEAEVRINIVDSPTPIPLFPSTIKRPHSLGITRKSP